MPTRSSKNQEQGESGESSRQNTPSDPTSTLTHQQAESMISNALAPITEAIAQLTLLVQQ